MNSNIIETIFKIISQTNKISFLLSKILIMIGLSLIFVGSRQP